MTTSHNQMRKDSAVMKMSDAKTAETVRVEVCTSTCF